MALRPDLAAAEALAGKAAPSHLGEQRLPQVRRVDASQDVLRRNVPDLRGGGRRDMTFVSAHPAGPFIDTVATRALANGLTDVGVSQRQLSEPSSG